MVTFVHEAGSSTAAVASFAQERRVQTVLGAAGGPLSRAAKNVSMLCRVPGPVDVGALTAAIRALVARHPALQYRFVARKDQVLLRRAVRDTPEFGCTVHDAVAGQDHEAVTGGAMREAVDVPFDVLGWPLLRAGVFPGTPSLVYLSVDHAVCDGYSATVAARDLEALYRGLVDGRPAELPPTGDFVAHSAAQRRRYADGPELDQAVDDMRSLLRGRPVEPEFPLPVTDWDAQMRVLPHVVRPHRDLPESHVFEDIMQLVEAVEGVPTRVSAEQARHVVDIFESGYRAAAAGQTQMLRTTFERP